MLKRLFKLRGDYHQAKEAAIEQAINDLESKNNPLLFFMFLSANIVGWSYAIFVVKGFAQLYEVFNFYPVIIFFLISYFAVFSGSKLIFKPSREEILDGTSIFAIFSACGRKEMRSLISIGLSLFQTLVISLYLVSKDISF